MPQAAIVLPQEPDTDVSYLPGCFLGLFPSQFDPWKPGVVEDRFLWRGAGSMLVCVVQVVGTEDKELLV